MMSACNSIGKISCFVKEEIIMRHIYIRGILALVWVAAAIVCGLSGSMETAVVYVIAGGVFLYSAYSAWNKMKKDKGE